MKARIVLLLLVCLSCTVVAHENGDDFISPWGQISFTGHWKGDDSEDKGHRSMPFIPVTASLEILLFLSSFRNLQVMSR